MKRSLFIFRRDLRLEDNLALISALKESEEVILSFIFTPEQIEKNPYRSDRGLQFMIESLEDLEKEISKKKGRLYFFYGSAEKIVAECIEKLRVEAIFVNHDYTPYSLERDSKIAIVCKKFGIPLKAYHDLLLHPIEETLKGNGEPYTVFTPFFHNASKFEVSFPQKNDLNNYYNKEISFAKDRSILNAILKKREDQVLGGRSEAIKILHHLKPFADYATLRDYPEKDKTTHLSPHLKFNTCSTREVYYAIYNTLGAQSDLIRSLYWRDFFTLIAFYFPHVFKGSFKKKYDQLKWENDETKFKLWCQGKTGFPIVDAGMRELNQTGFMHNRVRMITASFLVKDLHINWQWGEKYFASHLIDYDPAVNNGNWQWAASTGCDAQPYFRIFNPWLQAKKFDPDCHYIKKWVPELSKVPSDDIHKWYLGKINKSYNCYSIPIVDHSQQAPIALESYRKI